MGTSFLHKLGQKTDLYLGIPFKASDCTSPSEQKFKANIARNATFQGGLGPNFFTIWVKNSKKVIIFKNFALFSQS